MLSAGPWRSFRPWAARPEFIQPEVSPLSQRRRQTRSAVAVKTLIGTLLIDHEFCQRLLRERSCDLLAGFDLTDEERRSVLATEADSVEEFVFELYERLTA